MTLSSFDDLNLPEDLFTVKTSSHVITIVQRALFHLGNMELNEINTRLEKNRQSYLSELVKARNDSSQQVSIDSYRVGKNNPRPYEPPETLQTPEALASAILTSIYNSPEHIYLDEISKNKIIKELQKNLIEESASTALFQYVLGLEKAKRIQRANTRDNNPYYRFGKVADLFFGADYFLNVCDSMKASVETLLKKEAASHAKRRVVAKKAGKSRGSKYNPLKKRIFELLNEKYSHISSNAQIAASMVRTDLTATEMSMLTTDDPEHTISKWIGHIRNGKLTFKT